MRYLFVYITFFLLPSPLFAASFTLEPNVDGQVVFMANCAACHTTKASEELPSINVLNTLSANTIFGALTDGAMRLQGDKLLMEERVAVAEYLSGAPIVEKTQNFDVGMCKTTPVLEHDDQSSTWSGWGGDEKNARYQTNTGDLKASNISKLTLKWAFGIPDVTQARSQPAVYGGLVFMGSQAGLVFALDTRTGCTYWSFKARSGVRTAISVGEVSTDGQHRTALFFNDLKSNVYAIDAITGKELWSHKVDGHPAAMGTGALQYYDGRLYVPTSGISEEGIAGGSSDYPCCTFRGSITALDANTGNRVWKTYTVSEPQFVRSLEGTKELWGPSGVGVWTTPTIDKKRNRLYIATGNAYSEPSVITSDAIIALELDSGKIVWINQVLKDDIWSAGCSVLNGTLDNPGCPEEIGPDFDFAASPLLVSLSDGREIIVATQKSGLGFAFDPDHNGKTLWVYRWGIGSSAGGVFGASSDGKKAYFAVGDKVTNAPGGLHAVDLVSGERAWYSPPQELLCDSAMHGCLPAQSAAVTAIPGVVFSGAADGGVRAYDSETGNVIWSYDTSRSFDTVNGISAQGGSIDGPGAVIADNMLYVTSGNGWALGGMPGNVLLAFSLDD